MTRLWPLLLLAACATEPSQDEPYQAPTQYYTWYREVEACSERRGDFTELRFYEMGLDLPASTTGYTMGSDVWIRGYAQGNRLVVEHEMLHSLIGDGDHESRAWADCGLYPLTRDQIVGVE